MRVPGENAGTRRAGAILGRTPTIDEYKEAVEGVDLTSFAPPKPAPAITNSVHF